MELLLGLMVYFLWVCPTASSAVACPWVPGRGKLMHPMQESASSDWAAACWLYFPITTEYASTDPVLRGKHTGKKYLPWARAASWYWRAHGPLQWCFSQAKTTLQFLTRWQCWDFIGHFLAQLCFASCVIMVFLRSELLSLSCNSTDMTALTLNLGSFHIEGSTLLRTRAGQYTFISPKGIAG